MTLHERSVNGDNWDDLHVGERAFLYGHARRSGEGWIVTEADWNDIYVEDHSNGFIKPCNDNGIVVERIEDGLKIVE